MRSPLLHRSVGLPRTGRQTHARWTLVSALWALCSGPLVGACQKQDAAAAKQQAPAKQPRKVSLTAARNLELQEKISATGTLAAQDRVDVAAKTPGRLVSIDVDLGTPVKHGQSIAQIETADYKVRVQQAEAAVAQARALLGLAPDVKDASVDVEQTAAVRQARATLEEARQNRERSRQLLDRKLIGRADFDAVEANFARAESAMASAHEEVYNRQAVLRQRLAELGLARLALIDTTLVSPIDGVVQARLASVGTMLTTGIKVATIVRVDPLRLRLEIPERSAGVVRPGQDVRVMPSEGESYGGKIARLAPAIDEQNRTLTIEAEIPNSTGTLRPGAFVRAEVVLGAADTVVAVPASAIVVFAGIEKVITIKEGKAQEVVITSGRRNDGMVEVKSGLTLGTEVVVEPGNLQTGDAVQVAPGEDKSRAEAG
jgi:RND family efflux transporter MFP subunit